MESSAYTNTINIPCGIPCIAERKVIFDETPPGFTKELIKSGLFRAMENNEDIVGLLEILATNASDSDLRLLIATYLSYGQCSQAQETLERLSGTALPDIRFKQLYTVLIEACYDGRTEKDLTQAEKQTIDDISLDIEQHAVHAEAILTQAVDQKYIREPEKINVQRATFSNESSDNNESVSSEHPFIKVYPNPASEDFTILFEFLDDNADITLEILDLTGKQIKSFICDSNTGKIFVKSGELKAGIYFCRLLNHQNLINEKKIIISK